MKLMALDGNSIINRAFYGIRELSTRSGEPTNAIYGFLMILQKLLTDEKPDALCVTFDLPAPTFRHEAYTEYKAQRKPMPDELAAQLPVMKDVLDAMCIPRYELSGWEADDLLGTIAARCEGSGWDCSIVTGDKDSLQLVTDRTHVMHVKSRMGKTETKEYDTAAFVEEYGFEPQKIVDLKALMGDASDNIPGVAGVGEKTASELVRRFGAVSDIYAGLNGLDIKDSVRKKLEAGRESAMMSYDLATIRRDAPLEFSAAENLIREADNERLYELFTRLEFTRFIDKFGLKPPGTVTVAASEPDIIHLSACDTAFWDCVKNADAVALSADLVYGLIALGTADAVYVLRHGDTDGYDDAAREIFSDSIKKIGHDVKDIKRALLERGFSPDGWVFDTALAAYLISPTDSSYGLEKLAADYCGIKLGGAVDDNGQMSMLGDDSGGALPLARDAFAMLALRDVLDQRLTERGLSELYRTIELPLCDVLAEMEFSGFLVDRAALLEYGEMLSEKIAVLEEDIYKHAGETFNIGSTKQLGVILFEKLYLPAPKKTKTGYSTDIEVLDELEDKHPIIGLIKEYRELTKLKSTYADGLLKVIAHDGRIHTRFQMTVTATGRLSSTEPNLQNIPIRKETGGELRKMFVAADGNMLVDADYSQIELRLLAHIADDEVMRHAFETGEDIHTVTASQVFGVPLSDVAPIQRSRAKAVNFGIVYGISPYSLSRDIDVTPKEAKSYIDSYLDKYAGVHRYMTDIVERAKTDGYVATLYGRRRYLPELKSSNFNTRSFGERVALNMPIQGTAADIMKIAMIRVRDRLKREGLQARLILQIHDELIAECPESETETVKRVLREEMESAASLSVPLIAEAHSGKTWMDAK